MDNMHLLIITQKVDINDDNLGFFHGWIEEFGRQVESVIVICLQKGEYKFAPNVKVLSLGKPASRLKYLFRFYKYIWRERNNYDVVFVHMVPLWVVLGSPIFKIYRKKVYLWYTHKSVGLTLWLAEKFIAKIFTASPESCRLKSKKIVITGHGIDTEKFQFSSSNFQKNQNFKIITAGRITPIKNYEILIEAAEILKNKNFNFEIEIIGAPVFKTDEIYFEKLKNIIKEKKLEDKIIFIGAVPYKNIAEFYQNGDLFINFSDTGSIDKAVPEAMASGLLILTSNEAFKNILPEKYFTSKNSEEIAEKIIALSQSEPDPALSDYIVKNHGLRQLINKLISLMQVLK